MTEDIDYKPQASAPDHDPEYRFGKEIAQSLFDAQEAAQGGHVLAVGHLVEVSQGRVHDLAVMRHPNPRRATILSHLSRSQNGTIAKLASDRLLAESGCDDAFTALSDVARGGSGAKKGLMQRIKDAWK